jgi:hypothetical protein
MEDPPMPAPEQIPWAQLIFASAIGVFVSIMMTTGTIIVARKHQKWYTLLMTAGAVMSLLSRVTSESLSYLSLLDKIPYSIYRNNNGNLYAISQLGNICLAGGFLMTAIWLSRTIAAAKQEGPEVQQP